MSGMHRNMRRFAQIATLTFCVSSLRLGVVVPFLFCHGCPFASFACPIGVLVTFLGMGWISLLTLGVLGLTFTLLGRATCGWLCPFGFLQEFGGNGRAKIVLTKVKYLFLVMVFATLLIPISFCHICPAGTTFATIPVHLTSNIGLSFFTYVHLATLVLLLLALYFERRAFCRYICPLGALAGIFNRISALRIEVDESCRMCLDCLKSCPMGLKNLEDISGDNCILCGECVKSCKYKALRYRFSF